MTSAASSSSCVGLIAFTVVAALLQCTAADTYTVGDTNGWFISPQGAQFYLNWVSGKPFEVDDVLTFDFNAGDHDVAEVTKAEFDACAASNPIGDVIRSSPASITLNRTGFHYYICTFPQHCAAGQKLEVDVVAAGYNNTPTTPTYVHISTPATPAVACGPELAPTSGGDFPTPRNAAPSHCRICGRHFLCFCCLLPLLLLVLLHLNIFLIIS